MDPLTQAERAMRGDPEAVRALWETHRRWVAAIVLAHMPRDAELEDLLQEVAVRVVKQVHRVRDPSLVRPWLRSVAINVARTAGRRRKVRMRIVRSGGAAEHEGAHDAPAPLATVEEGRRALAAAHRLRPEYREPLILQCVRGMSYRQIADTLGVPVTTVETRLARARRMLREELEREGISPEGLGA
ncbi:MAG: RNA polymerase sigma factor [Phycisphaerales bacterium]|nr:RNA polymerase sigma factor [Phycisphaerales bacterium]